MQVENKFFRNASHHMLFENMITTLKSIIHHMSLIWFLIKAYLQEFS